MPTKKKLPRIARGPALGYSSAYDWNNDPFSDPFEKLLKKNAKVKKKYPKKSKPENHEGSKQNASV